MKTHFQDNKSEELIVLFNGWGMDEKPYAPLFCKKYDILFVSDYSDLELEHGIDFSGYKKRFLICFSAGIFMSSYVKDKLPEFCQKIAVNGVLNLYDKEQGVSRVALNDMKNLNLDNVLPFREKIIPDKDHLEIFTSNQPLRDLESCMKELDALESYYPKRKKEDLDFDKVLISKKDITIPVEHQLKSWHGHNNVHFIEGGHFPFYNFSSFEEIIKF